MGNWSANAVGTKAGVKAHIQALEYPNAPQFKGVKRLLLSEIESMPDGIGVSLEANGVDESTYRSLHIHMFPQPIALDP